MPPRSLDLDTIDDLRAAALRFGGEHRERKSRALDAAAAGDLADAAVLVAYHDCLLCLLAYPETRALRDKARAELRRVAAAAGRVFAAGGARARAKLANSGLAGTDVTINFGWDIARWLVARFPKQAEIDSFGEEGAAPQAVLGEALIPMEFELAASAAPPLEFIADACRNPARFAWLSAFERYSARRAARPAVRQPATVHRHPARPLAAPGLGPCLPARRSSIATGCSARSTWPRWSTFRCRPHTAWAPPSVSTSSTPAAPCSRRSAAKRTPSRSPARKACGITIWVAVWPSPSTRCGPSGAVPSIRMSA
jgi:hypothetical protein